MFLARKVQMNEYTYIDRKSIAVAHGSQISLFDQNSLMPIGTLKASDEVRVLTKHGQYLVAGGKGTQTSGALTIWDCRQTMYKDYCIFMQATYIGVR